MQLIEVIDAVRGLLNEPLDSCRTFPDNTSSFYTDSMLMTYHNLVQEDLGNDVVSVYEDFFVTQTNISLVANQSDYSLPAGLIKVRRVEDIRNSANSIEILPTSLNQRETKIGYLNSSGSLFHGHYYLRGNQIVFENTPAITDASAVRLHYVKRISDVTAGSGVSELPIEHHGALVWGTYHMALVQQQSSPEAIATAERSYEKKRKNMITQLENRQVQRSRRVVNTWKRDYL